MQHDQLALFLAKIPKGYSQVVYDQRIYSLVRNDFNHGRSVKIFARELGGTDFISCNVYCTSKELIIKPCEMPLRKVLTFFQKMIPDDRQPD